MEENKNLTPENEINEQAVNTEADVVVESQNIEVEETTKETKVSKKVKKEKKPKAKNKLLKNQAFLKRGSYSLAITAAFIAGAIIINILVGALSDRFVLEFDMSTDKINSISEENIEYIKSVEDEVSVIMCADAESYTGGYMSYYAQQYGISNDATQYYEQTIKLIDKYADYNKKIDVRYMDTQSAEFAEIASKFPNETLTYGDILVYCTKNDNVRHKRIGFTDIYSIYEQEDSYSYYGSTASVDGNNIETALTSAIAYVTSSETKKLAVISGHSNKDYTSSYVSLLKQNNYEVDVISDSILTKISDEYDALVVAAPTQDFIRSELDVISDFLENGGALDKGLIFFADVTSPYLTNFYEFLAQWGIVVNEGVLYETDTNNHMPDEPTTLGSYSSGKDTITETVNICITGYNAPLSAAFESQGELKVTSLVETTGTTVIAPVGTSTGWDGANADNAKVYSTLIQSEKSTYNDDNELIASYVLAFSSADFLTSAYNEQASVSNKEMTLAAAERAADADDMGITFVSKYIENESYSDKVTEGSVATMRLIFMIMLPIIMIVLGVYVYIKRRNS